MPLRKPGHLALLRTSLGHQLSQNCSLNTAVYIYVLKTASDRETVCLQTLGDFFCSEFEGLIWCWRSSWKPSCPVLQRNFFQSEQTMLLQTLKSNYLMLSIMEICITHLPYFEITPFLVFNNHKWTKLKIILFLWRSSHCLSLLLCGSFQSSWALNIFGGERISKVWLPLNFMNQSGKSMGTAFYFWLIRNNHDNRMSQNVFVFSQLRERKKHFKINPDNSLDLKQKD